MLKLKKKIRNQLNWNKNRLGNNRVLISLSISKIDWIGELMEGNDLLIISFNS